MDLTLPVALTIIGGLFAIAFAVVKIYQESKSSDGWKQANYDLTHRVSGIEQAQRSLSRSLNDLRDTVVSFTGRMSEVEVKHTNLVSRIDELRHGQDKLDDKIDKLTDLMIKSLSEN